MQAARKISSAAVFVAAHSVHSNSCSSRSCDCSISAAAAALTNGCHHCVLLVARVRPVHNGEVHAQRTLCDDDHMLDAGVMRCNELLWVVHLPVQAVAEAADGAVLQGATLAKQHDD